VSGGPIVIEDKNPPKTPPPDPALRLTDEQMERMRIQPLVVDPSAYFDPAGLVYPAGSVIPNEGPNRSLTLARRSGFLEMCKPLLWGDEKEEQMQQFGELLRGAVETFHPETTFDLYMLKAIVAAQWRLNRLLEMQANVFAARAANREPGKYGLPVATMDALEIDEMIDTAQKNVEAAISTYRKTKR
jgi:hypothetical protein